MHEQARSMSEELEDRTGVARACSDIGNCYLKTGDYGRAISYFTKQYDMAKQTQAAAALGIGVALRFQVRQCPRACC